MEESGVDDRVWPELKKFVSERPFFWWWIPESMLPNISIESVVEGTLSYGDIDDIKLLFQIMGIEQVASVFKATSQKPRANYHPRTVYFFNLYFQRHVPRYSHLGTTGTLTPDQAV